MPLSTIFKSYIWYNIDTDLFFPSNITYSYFTLAQYLGVHKKSHLIYFLRKLKTFTIISLHNPGSTILMGSENNYPCL